MPRGVARQLKLARVRRQHAPLLKAFDEMSAQLKQTTQAMVALNTLHPTP